MNLKTIVISVLGLWLISAGEAWPDNLLRSGDFDSLEPWTANGNLQENGSVTLLPADQGVTIQNPVIDLDGSLYQDIATEGHESFSYSVRIKGGGMMRASLGFVAFDAAGDVLAIETPTKVSGTKWTTHSGTVRVPPSTARLRTLLSVLDGKCSFANLELRKFEPSAQKRRIERSTPGIGFSVTEMPVDRPFWELFCDDLNGDGNPEIVGCDVDGLVTIRNQGTSASVAFPAGALVYQFAAADVDGDGVKEVLMSSVDPKIPLRAMNLQGNLVRVFQSSRGPERIEVCDMDGDGTPEVAASVGNGVPGSGVAAGVVLFDNQGKKLWEKAETLRTFRFGNLGSEGKPALVVGGARSEFYVYDKEGGQLERFSLNTGLLEQFQLTDLDGDHAVEIIASGWLGNRFRLICRGPKGAIWDADIPSDIGGGGSSCSAWHVCGDFDPRTRGRETVVVGTHGMAMFSAKGELIYRGLTGKLDENWQRWAPGGINSLDIAFWDAEEPQLYLSSSRFRHCAYYQLKCGGSDGFAAYRVPDQEKHLEEIYTAVNKRPALPPQGSNKVKVFMALSSFARAPESTLREYRKALSAMETPSLEYLVMYEASDLLGHERGFKLTTDQIVERARLLEQARIPFGYFAAHGGQVWITREALRRSKEAAPTMFRFLYIAENLETLYSPLYKDVLKWTDETLDFCADHGMKMVFKEKHDVWGLLPSDPEVSQVLFSPRHRETAIPIWSTNQPYQPEIQLGGMLGLKLAGYCREFGMSTQFWNWHEWGRYPRGIRDVSATYVCPSDIMLRLELVGLALGGTWIHVEGGQPYLHSDLRDGVVPTALRHRELAYELVRKNFITPGAIPANLNSATVVRSSHPALAQGKIEQRRVAYPYYDRNTEALRKGLIPARYLFETYPGYALPALAYAMDWNVRTCFPQTPNGWLPVVPSEAWPMPGRLAIQTDGELVIADGAAKTAEEAVEAVNETISSGAKAIPLKAPGTCLILHQAADIPNAYVAVLIDPGYLAPTGVTTNVESVNRPIQSVTDLVSGARLDFSGRTCPIQIQPGAFRLLRIELDQRY